MGCLLLPRCQLMKQLVRLTVFHFLYTKQDLMEDVKAKLDEEMQDTLDSLGCGAEEDATKLYEAMKVRLFLLTWWNFGCIWLLKDKSPYFKSVARKLTVIWPWKKKQGQTVRSSPPPPLPPLSISAPFYGYLKLLNATQRRKKSKERFEFTPENHTAH